MRALLAFGVVNPFFMGTADDAVRHDDRLNRVLADERQNLRLDSRFVTDIAVGEPPLHMVRVFTLTQKNTDRDLAGVVGVGTVKRNGRDRVSAKSALP